MVPGCRAWLSIDIPEISRQLSILKRATLCRLYKKTRTSGSIGSFVDSDETMTKFKHVVSKTKDEIGVNAAINK